MQWKHIITHSGNVHLDEVLACAFAQFASHTTVPIFRRDPTQEELNDAEVLVLDVGGRYQPLLSNFDHHLPNMEECACSLFLKHHLPGLDADLRRYTKWYSSLIMLDTKGPAAWSRAHGIQGFPYGLTGSLEIPVKALFEKDPNAILNLLLEIAREHSLDVDRIRAEYIYAEKNSQDLVILRLRGILYNGTLTNGFSLLCEEKKTNFTVCKDDRGLGWSMFRYGSSSQMDFRKLKADPRMLFVHPQGFMAKTKTLVSLNEVIELLGKAAAEWSQVLVSNKTG